MPRTLPSFVLPLAMALCFGCAGNGEETEETATAAEPTATTATANTPTSPPAPQPTPIAEPEPSPPTAPSAAAPATGDGGDETDQAVLEGEDDAAMQEAKQVFETRCVTCHGPQGEGDGPASAGLQPKPRDLTSAEFQDSITDEHIEKIIKFGGAGVGKSPMMPANPDLTAKPEVVTALRKLVRDLADQP